MAQGGYGNLQWSGAVARLVMAAAALCALSAIHAHAQTQAETPADKFGAIEPSLASQFSSDSSALRARAALHARGIDYFLIFTNDVLANTSGGLKRGTIDQGKLETQFRVDLEKFAGWQGWMFYANGFATYNSGRIRRDYVGGFNTIAAIEANPSVRLSELWLQYKFAGDKASIRVGQLAADSDFFFSNLNAMFMQSDWPTIAALNLPGGGPAYPLSTPGLRLKIEPWRDTAFLFAVFNGDPAGPCAGDPDTCNRYGLNFRVSDPPLFMGEIQTGFNQGDTDRGLASMLKLGVWGHAGKFNDKRFANDGTLLANPLGSGAARMLRGDYGIYGVVDQQLYRPAGAKAEEGISVFGRVSFSPSDRNLINFQFDGGIVVAGLVPNRPHDRFGVSVLHARAADAVRAFDRDTIAFGGTGPVRDYETNVELSYIAQIVPGWTVQPDFQYIFHPGLGRSGRDAKVVGVRTQLRY